MLIPGECRRLHPHAHGPADAKRPLQPADPHDARLKFHGDVPAPRIRRIVHELLPSRVELDERDVRLAIRVVVQAREPPLANHVRRGGAHFQVHVAVALVEHLGLEREGFLPVDAQVANRHAVAVPYGQRDHAAVKDELRALSVDLDIAQTHQRQADSLEPAVVIGGVEQVLVAAVAVEVVPSARKYQPHVVLAAGLGQCRKHGRGRVAAAG